MQFNSLPLPGGSGLSVTFPALQRAAMDASELAVELGGALYASDEQAKEKLRDGQEQLARIGHALGMTFAHAKPLSGAVACQRVEMAQVDGIRRHNAEISKRAAESDLWKHRAETATQTVRVLAEQIEGLKAEVTLLRAERPRQLEAAE